MDDVYKTTDKYNRHDKQGFEHLNDTPMQPPLGYKKTLSLSEQIRLQVRQLKALEDMEPETEEEADDFEIAEDMIQESRWENDNVPSIKETRRRIAELEEQERAALAAHVAASTKKPSPPAEPTEKTPT